jgi:transposase InsO family protein
MGKVEVLSIIRRMVNMGLSMLRGLNLLGLGKSKYYYWIKSEMEKKEMKRGRKVSRMTQYWNGDSWEEVPNEKVVELIEDILSAAMVDYGYHKMTDQLGNYGFWINDKKVYRLMDQAGLLLGQRIKKGAGRRFIQQKLVVPERPYEIFEMDIKQLYVKGIDRNMYLLTILDTFTRDAVGYHAGFSITQHEVKQLWEDVLKDKKIQTYYPRGLVIRNDNGSQFIAQRVQQYFKDRTIMQEFTHVATPEENGHIESFHAILEGAIQHEEFATANELLSFLDRFYHYYNTRRIHSSICGLPPRAFLKLWELDMINVQLRNGVNRMYLKTKRYLLKNCIGNNEPELSLCFNFEGSIPEKINKKPQVLPPEVLTSVYNSPSLSLCNY